MSFSGWLDPKVLVAIYAAILSTINLCMNLLNKKRIVKIRLSIKQEIHYPIQPTINPVGQYPILHVEAVNKSKKIRTKVLLEEIEKAHSGTKKLEEKFLKDKNDFMINLSKGFS